MRSGDWKKGESLGGGGDKGTWEDEKGKGLLVYRYIRLGHTRLPSSVDPDTDTGLPDCSGLLVMPSHQRDTSSAPLSPL